jgi:catechol-2,3-dioxygenase
VKNLKVKHLDHLTIEVHQIKVAMRFYTEILGFDEIETPIEVKSKGVRWLRFPGNQALHIIEVPDMNKPSSAHMAFYVEDIESWEKHLARHQIEMHPPKFDIYQARRFFIQDPSGNRIEFLKRLN